MYRAIREADGCPVIVKVLDSTRCRPADLERLRHEHHIGSQLDVRAVVRPIALETQRGMPALVLEDFGGEPLDRLLGAPMAVDRFLALALRMTEALDEVHGQGVVHKDLKPRNVLVHPSSLEVRIADFGLATRLSREQQVARLPALIEGSLPYLSPEQTGRMNRCVDSRSDLYSLGVIFYQMLTGRLPFEAGDALEWVHCHVARTPLSPVQLAPEVPEAIARIVLKLLAKMAEDRYQSARGLCRDLQRCLDAWRSQRRIDLFPLGEGDVSDRLRIPQKLYGRKKELFELLEALRRVVNTGVAELVLVSGCAGVGKSSLVHELYRPLVVERGVLLSGKFDEHKRNTPYSTLVQSLQELVTGILAGGDEQVSAWRQRLCQALGRDGQLIVDLIPHLELVIGRQPAVAELGTSEAQARFSRVFRKLIGALTARDRPLVLFLDDMQWADMGSVKLIEQMVAHPESRHLLVIGAYRDNEVSPSHPLLRTVDEMRQAGAAVREVALGSLSLPDVVSFVADALHCGRIRAQPLAQLLHEKTGGNPFFAVQFLTTLYEEGLVEFDRDSSAWRWDVARIAAKGFTSNVADFMAGKVGRLPQPTQQALRLASCIGNSADPGLLGTMCGRTREEIDRELEEAVHEGLLARVGDSYRFTHDRVREAAYLLVPEGERAATHLRIGRALLESTGSPAIEEKVFDIVDQLNLGSSHLADQSERDRLAELNLVAGRRARASHAYASAITYLSAGARLLGPQGWEAHYPLAFGLHLAQAECRLVSGNAEEALRLSALTAERARTSLDKSAALFIEQHARLLAGDVPGSIETGLRCLALLGVELSPNPSWEEVLAERDRVQQLLGDRPIESIVDLTLMSDRNMEAATKVVAPSFYTDTNLYCLHVARMVALCLEHGNPDAAVLWYGSYSFILEGYFEAYRDAARFARAAYDLMEKRGIRAEEGNARFFMVHASYWTGTLEDYVAHARAGFEAGVETGAVSVASMCSGLAVLGMLTKGDPLQRVYDDSQQWRDYLRKIGYRDTEDVVAVWQQFIRSMQGKTRALGAFDDERFDEERFAAGLRQGRLSLVVCLYWISKLQATFMAGDFQAALAAAEEARPFLFATAPLIPRRDFEVYHALALAALFERAPPGEEQAWMAKLEEHRRQIARWSEVNPRTFAKDHALVSAEMARIAGNDTEAARLYEESLKRARDGQFVQDEGIAYELASRFYRDRGFVAFADLYLREARSCYLRWGAEGKVKQLERLHPHLAPAASGPGSGGTLVARTEQIDLLSVIKASQAISREVTPDKLARTLVEVVLAQSGAEKGFLILARGGTLSIEAEAVADAGGTHVKMLEGAPPAPPRVPGSILKYVQRTGERVVLEDAASGSSFSDDEYMGRNRPRSVLCLPILRQGEVVGLLYLENNVLPGVFTSERLTVLELLAAQAAISLETARFLRTEQTARAAAEEGKRISAFVAEAGALLSESLDYEETLARLGRLCARSLADWCVIDIVENEEIRRLAGAHVDPAKETLLERLRQRYPPRWDSPHPAARCLRSGGPIELSDEELPGFCEDDEHLRLVRELGTRSALAVPLATRGRTLGVLTLSSATPGRFGRAEVELVQEVAGRAAIAIDNARLYRKTQQAIRARDEFLTVASHELRTPLATLTLSLQTLQRAAQSGPPLDSEATNRTARLASRQGERLNRLLADLLDVSRLESGSLLLAPAEVELEALVREVVERFEPELTRARCALSIHCPAPVPGHWDRSRIDQVVTNLLSNAIKFGAGEPIEVGISEERGVARLTVQDRGMGVDPAEQARIFERFERAASSKNYGGLGLGLYISRRIVEAHGGTIRVESRPGVGSTFVVELPCAGPRSGAQASA